MGYYRIGRNVRSSLNEFLRGRDTENAIYDPERKGYGKAICELPELKGYGESELRTAALSGRVPENVICEILIGRDMETEKDN